MFMLQLCQPTLSLLQITQPITGLLSLLAVIHLAEQAAPPLKEDLSRVYLHTQLATPEAAPPKVTHRSTADINRRSQIQSNSNSSLTRATTASCESQSVYFDSS